MTQTQSQSQNPITRHQAHYHDLCTQYQIPSYMIESIVQYIIYGHPLPHFLHALFSNQLVQTYQYADATNTKLIPQYTQFLHNSVPLNCWGSQETVHTWMDTGGLATRLIRAKEALQ